MNEVKEIALSYNEYIGKIPQGVLYIANCLREDQLNNALSAIKDFSEGGMWLTDAFGVLQMNGIDVELNIEQIKEFLNEINSGLLNQDFLLVADLFEYEIVPFFEELHLVRWGN